MNDEIAMMISQLPSDIENPSVTTAEWVSTCHTLALLGYRYYTHGLYAEAARLFEFVLRHDPSQAQYHCALGKARHAQGEHQLALQAYQRAMVLGLASAEVHFYIGQCELYLNHIDQAGEALRACLEQASQATPIEEFWAGRARHLLTLVHRHHQQPDFQRSTREHIATV
jgi:tetratricopeptide (TPR) repeat protein